jgi:hypothetical protein
VSISFETTNYPKTLKSPRKKRPSNTSSLSLFPADRKVPLEPEVRLPFPLFSHPCLPLTWNRVIFFTKKTRKPEKTRKEKAKGKRNFHVNLIFFLNLKQHLSRPAAHTHSYTRPTGPEIVAPHLPSCSPLPHDWSAVHDRFIAYLATHAPLTKDGLIPPAEELRERWRTVEIVRLLGERFAELEGVVSFLSPFPGCLGT